MNSHIWKVLNSFQSLFFWPNRVRGAVLGLLGCDVHRSARMAENCYVGSPLLVMEKDTYVNIGCFFDGSAPIKIREGARVGPYVRILTGTHTYAHSVMRRDPGRCKDINLPVEIGRGCWIGMGVMILPGVVIAEGCVIAAGSIVTKSTEPNGMYVGSPAKRAKDLPVE